ncbi:Metallo-dependent hydrolase [Calocera cornea HHB12733]|uniref:Metallo-dependent hydrolase n=1 Tax=Calocera cornea HHB12733 TaxID=1353952 RepID=A0A165EJW4_9BASI|nr:Metallo-dependent hydrolase [Calocera cornea HHB12733]
MTPTSPALSTPSSPFPSTVQFSKQGTVDNSVIDAKGSLVLPGLVHSHVHLDKPYLLGRCSIQEGTFAEAMKKTQDAKAEFEEDDLLSRGRQLIRASISHGVTTMRAHVEVDPTVDLLCVDVGMQLKAEFHDSCAIRLVVFAQDSIFSGPFGDGDPQYRGQMQTLLKTALDNGRGGAVAAIGSAPYVEKGGKPFEMANINYILNLAEEYGIDADFHLDFDISRDSRLMDLIAEVRKRPAFHSRRSIPARRDSVYPLRVTVGHCRSLSRIDPANIYKNVTALAQGLEIYIVGLPNSDMYMHHANEPALYRDRVRSLLNALELERQSSTYLQGRVSLSVNNVGNLFTPQGDGDPLALLPLCVAVYQDATETALASLLRMVTIQAASAAGLRPPEHAADLSFQAGEPADLVILDGCTDWRMAALSPPFSRVTIRRGKVVAKRKVQAWIEGDST